MDLPAFNTVDIPNRAFLLRTKGAREGEMIVVDSTVTDAGSVGGGLPRSTWLRQANVLGLNTGTGRFFKASDVTNVSGNKTGSVTSLIALGAGCDNKTFIFKVNGGGAVTITMGGADDTCDKVVTKLMASLPFAGNLVAANDGANKLVITTLRAGSGEYFEITTGTINGQGGAANDTFADNTRAGGSDGDYRVLGLGGGGYEDTLDMFGPTGAVASKGAPNLKVAEFQEAQLINLTPEAKAVLSRRGSIFG